LHADGKLASQQATTKASSKIMRISNKEELSNLVLGVPGDVSPERVGRVGISRESFRGAANEQINLN
jgi:hypothetical protein